MSGKKRAVIVGINSYKDKKISPLGGAVNDARELCNLLSKGREFDIDEKRDLLIDADATSERIRKAISDLFWKTDECDVALFYFAGHGRRDHLENGFLLPHDAVHDEPFVHGIDIQELKRLFLSAPANIKKTGLLILDCCYSGIATESERSRGPGEDEAAAVQSFYKALDLEEERGDLERRGSGRYILASADADKTARELEVEHACDKQKTAYGQFSFHLIEGLQALAKDRTGRVSLGSLMGYLWRAFPANATDRVKHAAHSARDPDSIILVTVAEEMEKFIRDRIREVEELLEKKDARSAIDAVRVIADLNKAGLWNDEVEFLMQEARGKIDEIKGSFWHWWRHKSADLPRACLHSTWHVLLKDISYKLCYDMLVKFDNPKFTFLTDCIEYIQEGRSAQEIGAFISLWEKDSQQSISVDEGKTFQKAKSFAG